MYSENNLNEKLLKLATEHGLDFRVERYPNYNPSVIKIKIKSRDNKPISQEVRNKIELIIKSYALLIPIHVDYIQEEKQMIINPKIYYSNVTIDRVIFNPPATIVLWDDGTKTVVKCSEDDEWDEEKGLALAILKKVMGNDNTYHKIFKKYIPKEPMKIVDLKMFSSKELNSRVQEVIGEFTKWTKENVKTIKDERKDIL